MKLKKSEIAALQNRWSAEETAQINRCLQLGRLNDLAIATIVHDGQEYLDLRGISIHEQIREVQLDHIDFSFSKGNYNAGSIGQFLDAQLEWCRFEGADLKSETVQLHLTHVRHCVFDRAKFAVLGGDFEYCTFVETRLSDFVVRGSRFIQCDFTNADWRRTHALDSTFDRCTWTGCRFGFGSLGGSRFIGSWPNEADLGDTIMDDTTREPTGD